MRPRAEGLIIGRAYSYRTWYPPVVPSEYYRTHWNLIYPLARYEFWWSVYSVLKHVALITYAVLNSVLPLPAPDTPGRGWWRGVQNVKLGAVGAIL